MAQRGLAATAGRRTAAPPAILTFPFVQNQGPRNAGNLAAGITNLFYWNNMLHDVMMSKGFDEVSGNFQYKNITGLGLGNDYVRAESQDGSGRNNANFSTPVDGTSGRMQMYLFDNNAANALTVTGPAAAAGTYQFASVSFGPRLTKKPLAGKLVLVNDGVSANGGDHGCASPFVNAARSSRQHCLHSARWLPPAHHPKPSGYQCLRDQSEARPGQRRHRRYRV